MSIRLTKNRSSRSRLRYRRLRWHQRLKTKKYMSHFLNLQRVIDCKNHLIIFSGYLCKVRHVVKFLLIFYLFFQKNFAYEHGPQNIFEKKAKILFLLINSINTSPVWTFFMVKNSLKIISLVHEVPWFSHNQTMGYNMIFFNE